MEANKLSDLCRLPEYGVERRNIFPSDSSLEWFVRQHKAELVEAGALVLLNKAWHAKPSSFDSAVLEIGQRAAAQRSGAA